MSDGEVIAFTLLGVAAMLWLVRGPATWAADITLDGDKHRPWNWRLLVSFEVYERWRKERKRQRKESR